MKRILIFLFLFCFGHAYTQSELLIYHDIKTDSKGNIISWFDDEPGKAWSQVVMLTWHFWDTMRNDVNGIPYYMNHQVWKPGIDDSRGIGGDQLAMALSSWNLLYGFCGDERIKQNMTFIIDYYLTHSLSPPTASWPNIPYPYNTFVLSGRYDGDMILGKDFTQPDKAGSFALELLQFYKMVTPRRFPRGTESSYLKAVIDIANTLAAHVKEGDENNSPLPFKVNALTGVVGRLKNNKGNGLDAGPSNYTTNWSATLDLFEDLQNMNVGDMALYKRALNIILKWMKKYPLQNQKWGPFFEDVPGYSDTQINAVTFAQYMMRHPDYFPEWKKQVKEILNWVHHTLGNRKWEKYGVIVTNEQTAYQVPGNSHSARQASAELQYAASTNDTIYVDNSIRELNWATYMVDVDGKNRYPDDENWLTDGYGDYIRHFLRAMAAMPRLAPTDENHLLLTTSTLQQIHYDEDIKYSTWDSVGTEIFRLAKKPTNVSFDDKPVGKGTFQWTPLEKGGILTVNRLSSTHVTLEQTRHASGQ
ncbi:MAG: hypothetical protein C5B52_16715 [Bacteroidetes bacterium]|nr:MAG: hypothetical protein C5B52_16715 [Bacteroidota bacterium]